MRQFEHTAFRSDFFGKMDDVAFRRAMGTHRKLFGTWEPSLQELIDELRDEVARLETVTEEQALTIKNLRSPLWKKAASMAVAGIRGRPA